MKPTKCPAKEKKWGKKKKRGGEKANKIKVNTLVSLLKPKNYLEILLSAHTQTSQANILHLDQKAAKCVNCTWKGLCGKI